MLIGNDDVRIAITTFSDPAEARCNIGGGIYKCLIWTVAAHAAATDGGVNAAAVDPAAVDGRVARDRAVADGGVAVVAGDPASVDLGRVARDRAAADGGVAADRGAVVAEDPAAAVAGRIARDRAAR